MFRLLIVVLLIAVIAVGGRYYYWIGMAPSPNDELGIAMHRYMPQQVQAWGCSTLAARFDKQAPPAGCQDPTDATKWRKT
ncbi:MAG: hypothetical protein SH859_08725 [Hyphomicrobium aestuarii]|nr:hypothetical protein [Hyphomicrobium aestuarii]